MDYANIAYKEAGISANEYMNQITSFSASLIKGLGGDTAAAAEIGNMAIKDMADNANTFGTSIESIQAAYQGFAKQNYTMLDNLKLGYAGTKEGVAQLINDTGVLGDTFVTTGKKGNFNEVVTFDKVIEAIHKVQEELNITGTTMKEAEGTIEGSINMTKAAWENFVTGLARSDADIGALVSDVVYSASLVVKNIVPVAKEVLKNIPDAIRAISPEAGEAFDKIWAFAQTAFEKVKEFALAAFPVVQDAIAQIAEKAGPIFESIVEFAQAAFPVVKEVVVEAFNAISAAITFVSNNIGLLAGVATAIGVIVTAIGLYNAVTAVKAALDAAQVTTLGALIVKQLASAAAMAVSIAPYVAIVAAIAAVIAIIVVCVKHWSQIKEACANAWNSIKDATKAAVDNVVDKFNELKDKASEKIEGMKQSISEKYNAMKEIMGTVMDAAKATVQEKLDNMKNAYDAHGGGIKGIAAAAIEGVKGYYTAGFTFIDNLTGGKLTNIANTMRDKMNQAKESVSNVLNSIKDKFQSILEGASNIVKNAIEKIKGFFNFSWSLPPIKLPHFSISGSFSLNPPSIPHFSVSWYKNGGVFDMPTMFGYGNGQVGGLGEDGAEAVVPLEKNTMWLDRLATMLNEKMGGGAPIVLQVDGKTFAQISVDSINQLTRQTGNLPLRLV